MSLDIGGVRAREKQQGTGHLFKEKNRTKSCSGCEWKHSTLFTLLGIISGSVWTETELTVELLLGEGCRSHIRLCLMPGDESRVRRPSVVIVSADDRSPVSTRRQIRFSLIILTNNQAQLIMSSSFFLKQVDVNFSELVQHRKVIRTFLITGSAQEKFLKKSCPVRFASSERGRAFDWSPQRVGG